MAHQSWCLPLHQHPCRPNFSLLPTPAFVNRQSCFFSRVTPADRSQIHKMLRAALMPTSLPWLQCRTWISTPSRASTLCTARSRKIYATAEIFNFLRQFQASELPNCFRRFVSGAGTPKALASRGGSSVEGAFIEEEEKDDPREVVLDDGEFRFLARYATRYSFVQVLEVSRTAKNALAGARVLLLDKPGNVHSIYQKRKLLTESYYDVMAALPAVIPDGPIAIFGLGAGTVARLLHHFWSGIDMYGWELDPGVIQTARKFFDLEDLEWRGDEDGSSLFRTVVRQRALNGNYRPWRDESDEVRCSIFRGAEISPRRQQGWLRVIVGDALGEDASVDGGFAGIVVDLFSRGAVIPALQEAETWREMKRKLRPHGRIIVNCGGSCVEAEGPKKKDGAITMRETTRALCEVFPQELCIKTLRNNSDNTVALTGPSPDFQAWEDLLPDCLRDGVQNWRPL